MGIRINALDNFMDNVNNTLLGTTKYDDYIQLEDDDKLIVVTLMRLAFKNIFKKLVESTLPVHLPYIGTLKIKEINKIALRVKDEVAIEFGYKSFNNIPSDIDNNRLNEIKDIISKRIIFDNNARKENQKNIKAELKLQKKERKTRNLSNPKVLTFDINKINRK